jgi:hypothetical protein
MGKAYRPMAMIAVVGCIGLIFIGVQPPNEIAVKILAATAVLMLLAWFGFERKRFKGPPQMTI